MPDLESILKQHLHPVSAPEDLRRRLNGPREPKWAKLCESGRGRRNVARLAWAAAAIVLVASSAAGLHAYVQSPAGNGRLQATETVRFRIWVKSATGLDIHAACRLCHDGEEQVTAFN